MPITQEQEQLAREIATKLDDLNFLQLHRRLVCTYSETHLRSALAEALAAKEKDIWKSRGALYVSIVTKYGYKHNRS